MKIQWRNIKNYEGQYQVSNTGEIKSLERLKQNHSKLQTVPEKQLKQSSKPNGYLVVSLWTDNKSSNRYVHRLVAEAFVHKYAENLQVNHIDMDKKNNALCNLEMVTSRVNHLKAHRCYGKKRGAYSSRGRFRAVIQIDNKTKHLGTFDTKDEAYQAYYESYLNLYGEAPWE